MDSFLHEKVLSLHDDRQKPIAIGHLRLSGDLRREIKKLMCYHCYLKVQRFLIHLKKNNN